MKRNRQLSIMAGALLACTIGASPALAQSTTQHIKGTTGLKSGSQPPPHVYVIAPLLYVSQGTELTVLATFLVKPLKLP